MCCMPNTTPVVDSPEWVTWMQQPERGAVVNVFPDRRRDARQQRRGAHRLSRPCSAPARSPSPTTASPSSTTTSCARRCGSRAEINLPVIQHAEDTRMTEHCSMNEGPTSFRLGLRGMKAAGGSLRSWSATCNLAQQIHRRAPARGPSFDRRRAEGSPPRQAQQGSRDLRSHAAPLRADRRGRRRLQHQLQDESAAALGVRTVKPFWSRSPTAPSMPSPPITRLTRRTKRSVEFERAAFGITGLETALGLAITQPASRTEDSAGPDCRTLHCWSGARVRSCEVAERWLAAAMPT